MTRRLLLALWISLSGAAQLACELPEPHPEARARVGPHFIDGRVVSTKPGWLKLRDFDGREELVRIDKGTRATRRGSELPVESIDVGRAVRVQATGKGQGKTARQVDVLE